MGGGLVCQYLEGENKTSLIIVTSPIGNGMKELPSPSGDEDIESSPVMDIVHVDDSYVVFLMCRGLDPEMDLGVNKLMRVYKSATNEWEYATNPSTQIRMIGHSLCCTMFRGQLHVLLSSLNEVVYELWAYNLGEDAWEDTGVRIHNTPLIVPQLIVSDQRLFLVSWMKVLGTGRFDPAELLEFVVSEVAIADKVCQRVFRMTRQFVVQVLHVKANERPSHDRIVEMSSFGFGKSIMLMCVSSGMSIVYDLVTSLWDLMPENPVVRFGPSRSFDLWYRKPMHLSLPCGPW